MMMTRKHNLTRSEWSRKTPLYLEKTDKRYDKHDNQLKKRGFSDSETWSLDSVICEFVLPRLIRFKKLNNGFPGGGDMTFEKWNAAIDEMIFAFDWSLNCEEDKYDKLTQSQRDDNWKRYEAGMDSFSKWFRHLWW